MNGFSISFLLLGATILLSTAAQAADDAAPNPAVAPAVVAPKIVAYVPNWIDLAAFAPTIDYKKITHLNLAFENPTNDEGDLSFERGNEIVIERAHQNEVLVLISIGGGAASSDQKLIDRYFALTSPAQRARFVAKLTNYVVDHKFDGLDVDLEGPSIGDDYGAFVAALSASLHARGKLVTAALSQGYGGDKVPAATFEQFDFVNIMAYDGAGPWAPETPGQHSSLEFARSNVQYWLQRGLPKSKAVLGVPFYGYGFGADFRNYNYTFAELVARYPDAPNLDQIGATIWYNGLPTMRAKAEFIKEEGLAGAMIWSLDSDATGELSLLSALAQVLGR